MPRILMVAQAFAPLGGSHSTRVTHLVRAWVDMGWDVSVLATKILPGQPLIDRALNAKVPPSVKIYRAYPGPLHAIAYKKECNEKKDDRQLLQGKSKIKSLLIPDTFIEWLPYAAKDMLKLPRDERPDIIISSAVPYTSHLIALFLHELWKVPWIADYGDPWVYEPNNTRSGIRFAIEHALETAVIRRCDAVTVVTEPTRMLYHEKYQRARGKTYVIPMGYDPDDFRSNSVVESTRTARILFIHTGRIVPGYRNTRMFLQALANLRKQAALTNIEFEFIGGCPQDFHDDVKRLELEDKVVSRPWAEHNECMDLLMQADYLMLFGNNNNIQVPGKLFNYIGSGKHIIYFANLSESDTDPVMHILQQGEVPYTYVSNKLEDIEHTILRLASQGKPAPIQVKAAHTWEDRAASFAHLFEKLLK